jgi:hypothetical protein
MQTESDVLYDEGFFAGQEDALAVYPDRPDWRPDGNDSWTKGWWAGVRSIHEDEQ